MKLSVYQAFQEGLTGTWEILVRRVGLWTWPGLALAVYISQYVNIFKPHFWKSVSQFVPVNRYHRDPLLLLQPESIAFLAIFIPGFFLGLRIHASGQFILLHSVMKGRWTWREAWIKRRRAADQIFYLQCLIVVVSIAGFASIIASFTFLHIKGFISSEASTWLTGISTFLLVQSLFVLQMILRDFLVPIMNFRNVLLWNAIRIFRKKILKGNGFLLLTFYSSKAILWSVFRVGAMVLGLIVSVALGIIYEDFDWAYAKSPYFGIGAVLLTYPYQLLGLPMYVLNRLFSLRLLRQLDPESAPNPEYLEETMKAGETVDFAALPPGELHQIRGH